MGTLNITNRYNNQDKRYAESVVITLPSLLEEGGGRVATPPVYMQGGDAYTAAVVEADTVIKRLYVLVDEAFPAGALINVNIAGTDYLVAVDGTDTGITVSTTEDTYMANGQTVTISVAGISGDITTGVARVILDTVSPSLKNGNYAAN